jgi:hypothetical protein
MKLTQRVKQEIGFVKTTLTTQNSNWVYAISMKVVCACLVISLGSLFWRFRYLPPQIPLWYSKAWGTDRLAANGWLFLLPGTTLLWYIIDVILSIYVSRQHYFFTQVLFFTSMFISVFLLIIILNILWLVA